MKGVGKYIAFLLILHISASGTLNAQLNFMLNSGFEEGVNEAYSYNIINGSSADVSGNASDAYSGDSALSLAINAIGSGGPQVIGVRQFLELDAGGKYLLSCAVKGPAGQDFRFRIAGDQKQYMNFTLSSGEWNRYEFLVNELLPSADGKYLCALEFAFEDNTAATWLIDEFKLEDFFSIPGNMQTVYVSPEGDDTNTGEKSSPVKTLDGAFEKLGGDTIFLMEGVYHQASIINGKSGTAGKPIVVTNVPGHKVLFDGTVEIDSPWELHSGNIYKTSFGKEVWQLFSGDTMLMPARWPNAFLHDGSVWDREMNWAHGNESLSSNGIEVDDPSGQNDLAASGIDASGAMAVMNVGSWKTSAREVLDHSQGSNTFSYDPVPFTYKPKHHYYYFEGTLELLDAPGEWCYVPDSGEIYVWSLNEQDPGSSLRGKDQSYAMSFSNCDHIVVKGIDFYATTLNFENCSNATVEDCNFDFPSCSKRALLDNSQPDVLSMKNSGAAASNNKIINCSIRNTESQAFYLDGNYNLVENCRMENIDWVVADRPGLMNSMYLMGDNNTFRRNTVSQCGASSTILPGNFPIVELNRIWSTGYMQSDGSITQVTTGGQAGSVIQYNWFHNTVKSGARFDAPIPPVVWGNGGTMRHNVIWQTGSGLMLKGEQHFCFNNTVYGTANNGIIILDDSNDGGGGNAGTVTRNNISDKISGHRQNWMAVPGTVDHNWNGYVESGTFAEQLLDPSNLDFRPHPGAGLVDAGDLVDGHAIDFIGDKPDIGAYEYGDSIYWIAGRKLDIPSTPVPRNKGVSNSSIIDLMWLEAYKAVAHDVYFSIDSSQVADAGHESGLIYLGRYQNNVLTPGMLTAGEKYFWRVDAVYGDQTVIKGKVWYFTAGKDANIQIDSITFIMSGREASKVFPLDSVEISIDGQTLYTDSTGSVKLTLPRKEYEWSVSKTDFESKSGSKLTESNMLVRDTLDRLTASVTFIVEADNAPLAAAEITLGTETRISDDEGRAIFAHFAVAEGHSYTVSLEGYETIEGVVAMESDTTLTISMLQVTSTSNASFSNVKIYPNPAISMLFMDHLPESAAKVEIYRMDGSLIMQQLVHGEKCKLHVGILTTGDYILRLYNTDAQVLYRSNIIINH